MTDNSTLILQAEIAALLHDIGKFTRKFIEKTIENKIKNTLHTEDFLCPENGMITADLATLLNQSLDKTWLLFPQKAVPLKTLGDLLKYHHAGGNKIIANYQNNKNSATIIPLAINLLMIADTLDSSSSKGDAAFRANDNEKRKTLLNQKKIKQNLKSCYLATPFGGQQNLIKLNEIDNESKVFQEKLAELLDNFQNWDKSELAKKRGELLTLMKEKLSSVLGETRLPNNDVTLWQHSYSTASIFKAMLSWHLLTEDYGSDGNKDLLYYRENLAFLGIKWNEKELIQRAARPKGILGIKESLIKLKNQIKEQVEIQFCLGNEVYKDGDRIYFLVPSPNKLLKQNNNQISKMLDKIEHIINNHDLLRGSVNYQIVTKDIGIQLLGLGDILYSDKKDVILREGPENPSWIDLWKESNNQEICSSCRLKPVPNISVTSGSEADEEKICEFCGKLRKNGENLRKNSRFSDPALLKEILGLDYGAEYTNFKTDELVSENDDNKRLALVQGFFDFRPFMSGDAYSSILSRRPEDYKENSQKDKHKDDKSKNINTWESLLKNIEDIWSNIKSSNTHNISTEELHTLQQLFQDTFLGKPEDGRIAGKNEQEKIYNYINNIVLASPFPEKLSETMKIILYTLRQHPAPSRLARIWEQTHAICSKSVFWCEKNKISYFPVNIESGKFLILLPAKNAWELMQEMYAQYLDKAKRIRHLLPFHLSASIFYYKAPLYIAMDAMHRFSQVQLSKSGKPELWRLKTAPEKIQNNYILNWVDHKNRQIKWEIPFTLPNGRTDEFYSWFWIEGKNRPFHITELNKEDRVYIHPSTFDFEVLDTTTRRYDIYLDETDITTGRPHLFCGQNGPRPYPVSDLKKWQSCMDDPVYKNARPTQLNRLITMVGNLHQEWKTNDNIILKAQVEDYLTLCLGKEGKAFTDMAVSGALLDLYEWTHLIQK